MLDYEMFYNNYFLENQERNLAMAEYALEETKKRLERAKKKQEEIDNLKYEKDLIMNNVINIIREDIAQNYYNIFRWLNEGDLLWEAWKYSSYKNDNRLKEIEEDHKKDPEHCKPLTTFKNSYNFVVSQVKKRLIPEKYTEESNLVEIIDWSYSTSYSFTFKYKNVEFIIYVPMFKNANEKNYLEILSGYILRYRESESCYNLAFSSINPDEFKEKLEKWIDERLAKGE